jgi:hypothetical protein
MNLPLIVVQMFTTLFNHAKVFAVKSSPMGEDPAPLELAVPAVCACAEVSLAAAAPADVGALDVVVDPTPPTAPQRQNPQVARR